MYILVLLSFSFLSFAQRGGNPACAALKNACLKAGYTMNGPQAAEKSVIGGCMAKIARDEYVPRLTVKATDPSIKPCVDFMKGKIVQITSAKKPKARAKPALKPVVNPKARQVSPKKSGR